MSNVANIADFRAPGFVPANDVAPATSEPAASLRGADVRGGLVALLRGLSFAVLKTVQVLAFVVLSVLRWPIRVVLGIAGFFLLIGVPMAWFGFADGSHEQALFTSVTAGGAVACALVRFFYDELLVRLDPRGPRIDA